MDSFETIWRRIEQLQGSEFLQKTGRTFAYTVEDANVLPSTTNRRLPKGDFRKAYERGPLHGPGALNDLQGPSYLWAVLTDPRVSGAG